MAVNQQRSAIFAGLLLVTADMNFGNMRKRQLMYLGLGVKV